MNTSFIHPRYKPISQVEGRFFFIRSDSIIEDIQVVRDQLIDSIFLIDTEGYDLNNVVPILSLKWVKRIYIYVKNIDLTGLQHLTQIEDLCVGEAFRNLDLSNFASLRSVYLVNGNFKGLNLLTQIKDIMFVRADPSALALENFSPNSAIEDLAVFSPKKGVDFSFLSRLKNLKKINLFGVKDEVDLAKFHSFSSSLEVMKFDRCKQLKNFEDLLPRFLNLKWLSLIDSITVSKSDVLAALPSIRVLVITGTSYFIDGNIGSLMKVDFVNIDDKKHYSLKNIQLQKILGEG